MRYARISFMALLSLACSDAVIPTPPSAEVDESGATTQGSASTVGFAASRYDALEGDTVRIRINAPNLASALTVTYALEPADSVPAAAADYVDLTGGSIVVASGGADVLVGIADDAIIDLPHEQFTVRITGLSQSVQVGNRSAVVWIAEGVCDRTPQVRDAIVAHVQVAKCHEVGAEHLAAVDRVELERVDQGQIMGLADPIMSLRRGDFHGLENAGSVWIRKNHITVLPAHVFEGLDAVTVIYGSDGRIERIDRHAFAGLSALRNLSLWGNAIAELPDSVFADLTSVAHLSLAGNPIREVPPSLLHGLVRLESLSLGHTLLTTLPSGFFHDQRNLLRLGFMDTQISSVPSDLFHPLESLEFLTWSGIRGELGITGLAADQFASNQKLTKLKVSSHPLETLPEGVFDGLVALESLDLGHNSLAEIPAGAFDDLEHLEGLILWGNELQELPEGVFDKLVTLRILYISGNKLTEFPPLDLPNLETFTVALNQIERLPDNALGGVPNLTSLYLGKNSISAIPDGWLREHGKLTRLYLHENNISELPDSMFHGLAHLEWLRLHDNPGAPFDLELEVFRADADALSAAPAEIGVRVRQGLPFDADIPIRVQLGTISQPILSLSAGDVESTRATIEGGGGASQVVIGSWPRFSDDHFTGLTLTVGEPLTLFAATSNNSPVVTQAPPTVQVRAEGNETWLDVRPWFEDADGDSLTLSITGTSDLFRAELKDRSWLYVSGLEEGWDSLRVVASDPTGWIAEATVPVRIRPPSPGDFNIDVIVMDPITKSQEQVITEAIQQWSRVLADTELSSESSDEPWSCGSNYETFQYMDVDDLLVIVRVAILQGVFVVARAGPCRTRAEGLPYLGTVAIQPGVMDRMIDDTDWEDGVRQIVAHELGHVLGIGTHWSGLYGGVDTSDDWHFKGANAIRAFDEAGGTSFEGAKVPLEEAAHWRESVFGKREMMTPSLSWQTGGNNTGRDVFENPLSAISAASLEDIGYTVDYDAVEPYRLPGADAAAYADQDDKQQTFVIDLRRDVLMPDHFMRKR